MGTVIGSIASAGTAAGVIARINRRRHHKCRLLFVPSAQGNGHNALPLIFTQHGISAQGRRAAVGRGAIGQGHNTDKKQKRREGEELQIALSMLSHTRGPLLFACPVN